MTSPPCWWAWRPCRRWSATWPPYCRRLRRQAVQMPPRRAAMRHVCWRRLRPSLHRSRTSHGRAGYRRTAACHCKGRVVWVCCGCTCTAWSVTWLVHNPGGEVCSMHKTHTQPASMRVMSLMMAPMALAQEGVNAREAMTGKIARLLVAGAWGAPEPGHPQSFCSRAFWTKGAAVRRWHGPCRGHVVGTCSRAVPGSLECQAAPMRMRMHDASK